MRYLISLCFLVGMFTNVDGIDNYKAGARPLALSDAYVSISDFWSVFHNQAGIAGIKQVTSGVFYESRFNLKELSSVSMAVILPTGRGNFALDFLQFGKGVYKEEKIGLSFAKKLSGSISAGIQLDYFVLTLPENERAKGFATFEAGFIHTAGEKLSLGIHLFNPVKGGIQYPAGKEKMPVSLRIGGQYLFSETLMSCLEFESEEGFPPVIKTGFEYQPVESVAFRFGCSGKPFSYTGGVGYRTGRLSTDIGFSYHENLSVTPSVSIHYQFR